MKSNMILTAGIAVMMGVGITAASAQQPVQLQPSAALPQVSTPQADERVTLGPAGTMFSQRQAENEAARVAGIAPAAGGPAPAAQTPGVQSKVSADAPTAPDMAAPPKTVGGAQMYPSKTIMDNIGPARDFTSFVKALKASGVDVTLASPGPFTVFAPDNRAFAKLPRASLAELMKPESKAKLTKLMNYHILAGSHDFASILSDIRDAGGKTTYQTIAGSELTATARGGVITLTDENGNASRILTPDVYQLNGVVHVVDTVVIPK